MRRAVPVLLATLLVLASGGSGIAVAPPSGAEQEARAPIEAVSTNTTAVLTLQEIEASTFARADLVVTGALASQSTAAVAAFERHRVEQALSAARTAEADRQVIVNATDWAERQTTRLLAEERSARIAYRRGEVSASTYLATLGSIHRSAGHVEARLERLRPLATDPATIDRIDALIATLRTLQGPVRADLARAVQGSGPSDRVFVAVSETGVTLSHRTETRFVRETIRFDNRNDRVGQMAFDEAERRFAELYPWASENKQRISMGALGADVYVVEYTHTHGTVHAALDASTGLVFREVQTKSLSSMPVDWRTWAPGNETRVSISRTYAGGPLAVQVTNGTGAPLSGTVVVNGTEVGSTGPDGTLWTVSPAGEFHVRVTTPDASFEATLDVSDR
ncbi:MAG: hypothetical protein ABEJ55_06025 [Halanaeroarchaeum sp.]